ncbi:group II intron maturase-specific domain-containing protein [Candidatus Tisiphia endosymbiont of Hybos culiciformis]|uniref:group II intron maturase-specific domain-containing protein n=1 Tax=Candidatus Tisiphia endosymbiont of Hybos culiciformis TaxID=3139331 RepID=UPI003CCAD3BD
MLIFEFFALLTGRLSIHKRVNGKKYNPKINLIRYADDWIITGDTKELLETQVKPLIMEFLKERGLELSPEKTNITHINDGFNFLSQNIRKYENKLIIKPSKKSIKNFLEDIRGTIRTNKSMAQGELIKILNPKLTGWANYHNAVSSASTFKKVSHNIWQALWQWCKRRHPKKNLRWIKSKYVYLQQNCITLLNFFGSMNLFYKFGFLLCKYHRLVKKLVEKLSVIL